MGNPRFWVYLSTTRGNQAFFRLKTQKNRRFRVCHTTPQPVACRFNSENLALPGCFSIARRNSPVLSSTQEFRCSSQFMPQASGCIGRMNQSGASLKNPGNPRRPHIATRRNLTPPRKPVSSQLLMTTRSNTAPRRLRDNSRYPRPSNPRKISGASG